MWYTIYSESIMRAALVSIVVALLLGSVWAKEYFVGELPVSPSVGTEVSTNVPFNVSRNDTMTFTVEMEQDGVESNNVQVAFGQDLDDDGDLAPDESDLVIGWRRGSCFIEDVGGEARWFDDSAVDIEKRTLKMKVVNDSRFRPRAVSFSSELGDCFSDLGVPEYLFRTNWNLFKVTRRGVESADEWCLISSSYRSFAIHIR